MNIVYRRQRRVHTVEFSKSKHFDNVNDKHHKGKSAIESSSALEELLKIVFVMLREQIANPNCEEASHKSIADRIGNCN